jgi:small neutral amino acid transporter SnatA (MarC family)
MRLLLVLSIAVAAAMAGAPSFTICGSGTLKNVKISTDDNNWAGGKTVAFTISGDLESPIVAGSKIKTLAKFSGTDVDNKLDDLCTYNGTPFKCPEAAGHHSWTFPFAIPSIPFPGKLTSHSDFVNADGTNMLCMELAVQL